MPLLVQVESLFDVPAERAWELVRDFCNPHKWIEGVTVAECDGSGVGAKRRVIAGHAQFLERLVSRDEEEMTMSYELTASPLPLARYLSMLHVIRAGAGCRVCWVADYECRPDADVGRVEKILKATYEAGLRRLGEVLQPS